MNTSAMRQQLHSYLEVADNKKVKAIFAIMENEIQQSAVVFTDEFKEELDTRYMTYKSGNEKGMTSRQSKKRISTILKAAGSKK